MPAGQPLARRAGVAPYSVFAIRPAAEPWPLCARRFPPSPGLQGQANPLVSSFKLSYYTLLNLLKRLEDRVRRPPAHPPPPSLCMSQCAKSVFRKLCTPALSRKAPPVCAAAPVRPLAARCRPHGPGVSGFPSKNTQGKDMEYVISRSFSQFQHDRQLPQVSHSLALPATAEQLPAAVSAAARPAAQRPPYLPHQTTSRGYPPWTDRPSPGRRWRPA